VDTAARHSHEHRRRAPGREQPPVRRRAPRARRRNARRASAYASRNARVTLTGRTRAPSPERSRFPRRAERCVTPASRPAKRSPASLVVVQSPHNTRTGLPPPNRDRGATEGPTRDRPGTERPTSDPPATEGPTRDRPGTDERPRVANVRTRGARRLRRAALDEEAALVQLTMDDPVRVCGTILTASTSPGEGAVATPAEPRRGGGSDGVGRPGPVARRVGGGESASGFRKSAGQLRSRARSLDSFPNWSGAPDRPSGAAPRPAPRRLRLFSSPLLALSLDRQTPPHRPAGA
jgi:hypothetical protein